MPELWQKFVLCFELKLRLLLLLASLQVVMQNLPAAGKDQQKQVCSLIASGHLEKPFELIEVSLMLPSLFKY